MKELITYLTEEQKTDFLPTPIELKKGYGSFHHPILILGSYENKSPKPRRAFVLNVFKNGTIANVDDALMPGTPPIPKGHMIQGQFFPLLFDPIP